MKELKKCPFCGGEAKLTTTFPIDEDGLEMNLYSAGCETCGIEFSWLWDKEMPVELWNNRATEAEIRAKAIDDFAENISLEISESLIWGMIADCFKYKNMSDTSDKIVDYIIETSKKIAEQLKVGD